MKGPPPEVDTGEFQPTVCLRWQKQVCERSLRCGASCRRMQQADPSEPDDRAAVRLGCPSGPLVTHPRIGTDQSCWGSGSKPEAPGPCAWLMQPATKRAAFLGGPSQGRRPKRRLLLYKARKMPPAVPQLNRARAKKISRVPGLTCSRTNTSDLLG